MRVEAAHEKPQLAGARPNSPSGKDREKAPMIITDQHRWLIFSVTDSGLGVSEKEAASLFQVFALIHLKRV